MKKLLIITIALLGIWACTKKYKEEFQGPAAKTEFTFVQPFKPAKDTFNFTKDSENAFFSAEFDKEIPWVITITGLRTGAVKVIQGVSNKVLAKWDGTSDALHYFYRNQDTVNVPDSGEKCLVRFAPSNSVEINEVTGALLVRGEIANPEGVVITDTIQIFNRKLKRDNVNVFELFPYSAYNRAFVTPRLYNRPAPAGAPTSGYQADYEVAGSNLLPITTRPFYPGYKLDFAPTDSGIVGKLPFMIAGTDLPIGTSPSNYYIGRVEYNRLHRLPVRQPVNKLTGKQPNEVFFSVYVYGFGEPCKLNYTVKEDENLNDQFTDGTEDAYEKAIEVTHKGWKVFTFGYDEFVKVGGNDGTKNPDKIISIQFGLIAANPGGSARVVFDYPLLSLGRAAASSIK
jgi:hypothetical protein